MPATTRKSRRGGRERTKRSKVTVSSRPLADGTTPPSSARRGRCRARAAPARQRTWAPAAASARGPGRRRRAGGRRRRVPSVRTTVWKPRRTGVEGACRARSSRWPGRRRRRVVTPAQRSTVTRRVGRSRRRLGVTHGERRVAVLAARALLHHLARHHQVGVEGGAPGARARSAPARCRRGRRSAASPAGASPACTRPWRRRRGRRRSAAFAWSTTPPAAGHIEGAGRVGEVVLHVDDQQGGTRSVEQEVRSHRTASDTTPGAY